MRLIQLFLTLSVIALTSWTHVAASSKSSQRKRMDMLQRKFTGVGRSAISSTGSATSVVEGRGLMKKFLLFKSMFQQPQSNIIIITQTTTTTTAAPTTTATTTTAARFPTGFTSARDESDLMDRGSPEDIFQSILGSTNMLNNNPSRNRGPANRSNARKRRRNPQQRYQNRKRIDQIVNNISRDPSLSAGIYTFNGSGNNSNNKDYNTPSTPSSDSININDNARIQNILKALRQEQTPIVYN